MITADLTITNLVPAPWNPNVMDAPTMSRLRASISKYNIVEPLVVRIVGKKYEVLSGNQRLKIVQEMGFKTVPCVVLDLDDASAMLLAQALNGIHGEDDYALKSTVLKRILSNVSEKEVLSILPETADSLKTLSTISETDMAESLTIWEKTRAAKLHHMQLEFTDDQLQKVQEAIELMKEKAMIDHFDNPNTRGECRLPHMQILPGPEGQQMNTIGCPVCGTPLSVTGAKGRKSKKPFIMLKCNADGRHFRGFITDQAYVQTVLTHLKASPNAESGNQA